MFEHKKIRSLEDFFVNLSGRANKCVYFYRINSYNNQIDSFLQKFYEEARKTGVVIEGRLPNPTEANLAYYNELMGSAFSHSAGFIDQSLKKWLPRMSAGQRASVSDAMFNSLEDMRKSGKNENILKNAYIKFMCWLYYKFERIVNQLGSDLVPKILYDGTVTKYELMMFSILSGAGCDVVLIQREGDGEYVKLDPAGKLSDRLEMPNTLDFPADYGIARIRDSLTHAQNVRRLYGDAPQQQPCTNAWIKGNGLPDFLTPIAQRGSDPKLFYNCFCALNGVDDKITYQTDVLKFHTDLKNTGRKVVVAEKKLYMPTPDELAQVKRSSENQLDAILSALAANICFQPGTPLRAMANRAFLDLMMEESKRDGMTLSRLAGVGVYLICRLKHYRSSLFENWRFPDVSCFIFFGACGDMNEALFLRFLSRLPVDVLVLRPNLSAPSVLRDSKLYELKYSDSMDIDKFPSESMSVGTAAYHAERELDSMMYSDTGIYRDRQHGHATTLTLRTMYEEIAILWDQELKYRPNFSAEGDKVTMPVIFAKVSGVKDRDLPLYWQTIKQLITPDTLLIEHTPYVNVNALNEFRGRGAQFFQHGKLCRDRIKADKAYRFGVLRDEIQEHILDKLQLLIDKKLIRGTGVDGTEYAIVQQILNLDKGIIRMIQQMDFTKKNPKVVYINTTENIVTKEDSILIGFLSLVGFDVVFFVPTGYQTVEKFFDGDLLVEHQIGDYVYDMRLPDFRLIPSAPPQSRGNKKPRQSWRNIFKRGT